MKKPIDERGALKTWVVIFTIIFLALHLATFIQISDLASKKELRTLRNDLSIDCITYRDPVAKYQGERIEKIQNKIDALMDYMKVHLEEYGFKIVEDKR